MTTATQTRTQAEWEEAFRSEYRSSPVNYRDMGISEASFIKSRMVDEGLGMLSPRRSEMNAPRGEVTPPPPDLANAKYEQEFQAHSELYAGMGLTKEQFVRSRRLDEGLDTLLMKTAPA